MCYLHVLSIIIACVSYESNNNKMIQLLESRGADINIADAIGFTPSALAERHLMLERDARQKVKREVGATSY